MKHNKIKLISYTIELLLLLLQLQLKLLTITNSYNYYYNYYYFNVKKMLKRLALSNEKLDKEDEMEMKMTK